MRATSKGYKYNSINLTMKLLQNAPTLFFCIDYDFRQECVSVNIYLLLHSFCVLCYISHTQTELLMALSLPSLYFQWIISTLSILYVFSCSKPLHYVYDSQNFLKRAIFINCPIKCMYYIVSVSDMIVRSLSAFPLTNPVFRGLKLQCNFASPTTKFQLEFKCFSIRIYF